MYLLSARIEIKGERLWQLPMVTAVEVVRDTEKLTTECRVTLPKRLRWDGSETVPVRRGDAISVWLGYDERLELAFTGYVREVGFKTPIVLTCEDEMFRLKQKATVKKAYKAVDIQTLLADQGLADVKVFGEQNLGQFRVTDDTVAALLGRLQQSGIRSFYRMDGGKPTLYCGVLFERDAKPSQVFARGLNIIGDQSLEQKRAEDIRLSIKAVSIMPNNRKIKVEVGDKDGEKRTLHTYNKQEKELRAWAEQEMRRLKADGLTGSLTTFGYRLVDLLDNIGIKMDGKRMGVYQVAKNTIKYSSSGYRQEITLGQRVAQ
ncbi:MAG: hypothetical protein HUK01_07115 [Bacteroidaceae bacterium]|nr:hypothetical protein [Bacteroidaceae bacterium]